MNHDYVVSFTAGSSGRFLSAIIGQIVYDLKIIWPYSKYNSCHILGHVSAKIELRNEEAVHSPRFWSNLFFHPTPELPVGIQQTHTYPNWDDIRNRENNFKIIIISYTPDDVLEIETNGLYKNIVELIEKDLSTPIEKHSHFMRMFAIKYYKLYGKKFDTTTPMDVKTIEEICINRGKKISPPNDVFSFYSHNLYIPDDFLDRVLVIPFSNLTTQSENGYLVLDQLSKFIGKPANDVTLQNYKNYVDGRTRFIKNYASWLKE
jgi:hypothetical protein